MNITVGQFNVISKDLEHNFKCMENLIKEAITSNFDMIVFGEYALTGYACEELFNLSSFYKEVDYYTDKLNEYSDKIIIVFGSITQELDRHYVSATLLEDGKIDHSFKSNLYKREFNENDYFKSNENTSFITKKGEVFITFEDDYDGSLIKDYEYTIILGSSPVNNTFYEKEDCDLVYANTLGLSSIFKTVFINGGNSFVRLNQKTMATSSPLATGLTNTLVENEIFPRWNTKLEALTYGIKEFSNTNFGAHKKWIVGNSGGLDSAITIALLTIALGKDNVISYNMRSKFNSDKTVNNANNLAFKLGIKNINGNIDHAVEAYIETLHEYGYDDIPTLAYENIQARTRGHLLGGFSSLENAVISNNGNKMEIMLGYATLYGDTIGALASLGDLLKIEVFELGYEINEYFKDDVIPTNLLPVLDTSSEDYSYSFDMPPSAELKSDQIDPMKWFYHDYLLEMIMDLGREKVLELYLENQFKDYEISHWMKFHGMDNGQTFVEDFNWFVRTMEINSFKRLQTPPILAYSYTHVLNVDIKETSLLKPKSETEQDLERQIIQKY